MMEVTYYALAAALCLLISGGCGTSQQGESPNEAEHATSSTLVEDTASSFDESATSKDVSAEDSLFALLQRLDYDRILDAFAALHAESYTRYVRTEQFDREGYRLAYRERIVQVQPGSTTVRARDSSGTFKFGYLEQFVSRGLEADNPANLAEYVVPDDPAYLSSRSREAYEYRIVTDTLSGHGEVYVIQIRAHPERGSDLPIKRAHLYLKQDMLVAMHVLRTNGALWFREWSNLFLSIRRDEAENWVPAQSRIETRIRMPFRPVQQFRTVSAFYAFTS